MSLKSILEKLKPEIIAAKEPEGDLKIIELENISKTDGDLYYTEFQIKLEGKLYHINVGKREITPITDTLEDQQEAAKVVKKALEDQNVWKYAN